MITRIGSALTVVALLGNAGLALWSRRMLGFPDGFRGPARRVARWGVPRGGRRQRRPGPGYSPSLYSGPGAGFVSAELWDLRASVSRSSRPP